jgi:hypothetical protein
MRRTAKQWERIVAEYEASGEAMRGFALRRGIPVSTLTWRVRRHREAVQQMGPQERVQRAGFVEVVGSSEASHLRIRTGTGVELEFGSLPPASWVSELLGGLA